MTTQYRQLALLFTLIVGLSGCEQMNGQANTQTAANGGAERSERPAHAVEIMTVTRQPIRIKRTLTGSLEVPRTVHVHGEQSGRIIELPFHEGDRVKQGEVLVRLDDALIRSDLAKAVASRKQTEIDLKRLENLVPRQLATQDELARARTNLELTQAEENLQRTRLSRTVIAAPFAGVVSERLMEPSDVVALNDHIMTLFDPDFMTTAVQVPEQLHSRVSVGDAVEVRIDSLGDRSFTAHILRIHPVVDPETRQGTVEIRLDPVPRGARPGQLSRITLETAETPRRVIPLNALQFDSRGSFVYKLTDDARASRSAVVTGLQFGETIEIIEGVDDGEQIITKGFLGLKSGKDVRVVTPPGNAAQQLSGSSTSQG